jgi:hypothetical protein
MQYGYQCGMTWGAALAAGAQAYRHYGPGPQAEAMAILASQRLVETFRMLNKGINCLDITGIDKSSSTLQMITYFLIKGGTIGCMRKAAKYAKAAFEDINSAFCQKDIKIPTPPLSCASILTQKMGLSDLHRVMVAGLAGGIGLSGSGCGALGAAIWVLGMSTIKEGKKIDYKSPIALELIDRFLKFTDNEFKCSKIVGRKFEHVKDHTDYLRDGGCSELIEALANQ